jgi:RNA 2',3'-cyclic 3'-phosphodiesterase
MYTSATIADPLLLRVKREAQEGKNISVSFHARYEIRFTRNVHGSISRRTVMNNAGLDMIRTFLAVELSQEIRAELAVLQQELKQRIEPEITRDVRISWVQPANIHLTIKFFGDIDEQVIGPLLGAIKQAVGSQPTVIVPLERLGTFPRPHNPRVLWVGPSDNWEQGVEGKRVAAIHGAIEQACEGLGFPRERKPFSPHLTLARIKAAERHVGVAFAKSGVLDRPCSLRSLAMESVALMKSDLKPTGSIYTKLWEVILKTG